MTVVAVNDVLDKQASTHQDHFSKPANYHRYGLLVLSGRTRCGSSNGADVDPETLRAHLGKSTDLS
jgi:hypothetical protein